MRNLPVGATTRALIVALGVASFWISACGTVEPDVGGDSLSLMDSLAGYSLQISPIRAIVSDPVFAQGASSEAPAARSELDVVYVSLAPGSTTATDLTISNEATSFSAMVSIVEGGFDPVVVPASVGHALGFGLFYDGIRIGTWSTRVEAFIRPSVVRTTPSRGQRDIPLASSVAVVFSEPMDPATVTPSTLRLLRDGVAVGGTVTLASDGLSALFIPDSPLAAAATHVLRVDVAVRDWDGDSLGVAELVEFTTTVPFRGLVVQNPYSNDAAIYRVDEGGGPALTLLVPGDQPAWSPDGRRIAFRQTIGDNPWRHDVFLMDADGSNVVRRTYVGGEGPHPSGFANSSGFGWPTWSPDGEWLAVATGGIYVGDIFVVSAAGDQQMPIHIASMAAHPAWSPDGSKIAFVSLSGDDGYHALHVMSADGSDVREVVPRDYRAIGEPTWSPDGQRIAFSRGIGAWDLYSVSLDGSASTKLTDGLATSSPSWSPDGAWIAFTLGNPWTSPERAYSIGVVPALTGGRPFVVVAGENPAWRP